MRARVKIDSDSVSREESFPSVFLLVVVVVLVVLQAGAKYMMEKKTFMVRDGQKQGIFERITQKTSYPHQPTSFQATLPNQCPFCRRRADIRE